MFTKANQFAGFVLGSYTDFQAIGICGIVFVAFDFAVLKITNEGN
jgi:cell shape-determining protein MreD